MGFFTNIINYIKNIEVKNFFKKVVPTKGSFESLINKFRRKPKSRTPDEEYGFTNPPTTIRQEATSTNDNDEPIYVQVISRKSVVGIVGPTTRIDDPTPSIEVDTAIGRPSVYTDRTKVGIKRLMDHLNDKEQKQPLNVSELTIQMKKKVSNKPKRMSDECEDLKTYVLEAINEIEMIRHQIHMKSEIVKSVDCNEADLEFVQEYLTSCMMEIEDVDSRGILEVDTAKQDALYYANQWYDKLAVQLQTQQESSEDVYVRATLQQLEAVKNKLNRLSNEVKTKTTDAENSEMIRRLSQYIDDIEKVDTKAIGKIEAVKKQTLKLAEDLTEDIHEDILSKRTELLRSTNEDYYNTQITEDDIYDEVSISSSSENVSIKISDSDSNESDIEYASRQLTVTIDNDSIENNRVPATQFILPDILIDSSEVQEVEDTDTERNRLSVLDPYLSVPNTSDINAYNSVSISERGETSNVLIKNKQQKFVAINFASLDSSDSELSDNDDKEPKIVQGRHKLNKVSHKSSSRSSEIKPKQIKRSNSQESPHNTNITRRKPPSSPISKRPTLDISHQETINARASKKDLEFAYTQDCLQEILLCRNRLECLADSVQSFKGTIKDDEFVFLQENITFSMMALNAIDAKSIKPVQDMKREAMMYGQIWYDELELKSREISGG